MPNCYQFNKIDQEHIKFHESQNDKKLAVVNRIELIELSKMAFILGGYFFKWRLDSYFSRKTGKR